MPASFRLTRFGLLILLVATLMLGACASTGPMHATEDAGTRDAEALAAAGDLDAAANAFLQLADSRGSSSRAHFLLRAGEMRREAGDLAGAASAVAEIKRKRLEPTEALRLDLLQAEIALTEGDPERASALLTMPDDRVPAGLHLRLQELRARTAAAAGNAFTAARIRARMDTELSGADRDINRAQIIETLTALDDASLRQRAASLAPDDLLQPWIEQTLRQRGQVLARQIPRPERPVGTLLPDAGQGPQREGFRPVTQVAVLLPLDGPVGAVSRSILDGFYTAHFADEGSGRPQVRSYDAGNTPESALAAYQQAVADGAGIVVGPLRRDAVAALFSQPLPVRVLALNHPDSGETPPAGSAEFGLLPEAEGAQAAERMIALGLDHAALFGAESDWADRAVRAFQAQFEALGGRIVGSARIAEGEFNFKAAIESAAASLKDSIAPDTQVHTPQAGAGVFISMRPQQARLLMPQLRLANVNVPVLATSHVYSGDSNPRLDRDLNGIEFCDASWLFSSMAGHPARAGISRELSSANGLGGRLFAFGMDAYALLPYLDWLLAHPDAYLDGASGQLTIDSFGRVHRLLTWARFVDGMAQPVLGALSSSLSP